MFVNCIICDTFVHKVRGRKKVITSEEDARLYSDSSKKTVSVGDVLCGKCRLIIYNSKSNVASTSAASTLVECEGEQESGEHLAVGETSSNASFQQECEMNLPCSSESDHDDDDDDGDDVFSHVAQNDEFIYVHIPRVVSTHNVMQPVRAYGGIVQRGRARAQKTVQTERTVQATLPRESSIRVARDSARPYDIEEARLHRAVTRTRPLVASDWNGHLEMTDECKLGLALFQVDTSDSVNKEIHIALKDGIRSKRVEIHRVTDYSAVQTYLFRRSHCHDSRSNVKTHGRSGRRAILVEYTLICL
ncbi:unnamed protein product, partial [Brenthis ino]